MTNQGFYNYSFTMDADFKVLEEKLDQLLVHCKNLRAENIELRQDLAKAREDSKLLRMQMQKASSKLEALIGQLPEGVL